MTGLYLAQAGKDFLYPVFCDGAGVVFRQGHHLFGELNDFLVALHAFK